MSLRRRGAIQLGYAGVRHSHATVSSAVAVDYEEILDEGSINSSLPDTNPSELFWPLPQTLLADQQEVEMSAGSNFDPNSPYLYAWIEPVVEYDTSTLEVFFPSVRTSPAPSIISVAAPVWRPFAPASAHPIERTRPIFIRGTDSYLFPEAPLALSTFNEQINEIGSIASSDMVAPSVSVNQDFNQGVSQGVNQGVFASIRALAFFNNFNRPEVDGTTASPPTTMKRPSFRIWRRRSSNRMSQSDNNGNVEESVENVTVSEQPLQRSRTLFSLFSAPMGLRRRDATQTM